MHDMIKHDSTAGGTFNTHPECFPHDSPAVFKDPCIKHERFSVRSVVINNSINSTTDALFLLNYQLLKMTSTSVFVNLNRSNVITLQPLFVFLHYFRKTA
ncbi:hypothetical protein XENOCAPTIV_002496 [Xenoophorus captivus]|uniref:Uncharacterized protein n=1 Tax=Xenoophorus captivus TaxID=1517983 RepID=A0ABV0Q486_9TELE